MLKRTTLIISILAITLTLSYLGVSSEIFAQERNIEGDTEAEKETVGKDETVALLGLIIELKSISLETSILEDKRFKNLVDFSVELLPKPQGRPNPFLPVGIDSAVEELPASLEEDADDLAPI
jgi:hypothetical protein